MNDSPNLQSGGGPARWLGPGPFFLLVTGLLVAMYPQVILGDQTFFFRDYGMFGYPLAWLNHESFWSGHLPLWNPYNDAGIPHLAQWNSLCLYPGSLFYMLLPMPWSLATYCLLHLAFAALGMYWLVRYWTRDAAAAFVAGAAFAFNGLAIHCLMWPNNVACYAWMPWVFYAALRAWREGGRRIVVGALAAAMQVLAGTPEIIMLTWGALGSLWLLELWQNQGQRRAYFLRFAGVGALALALTAAQLLPFAELLHHAHRTTNYTDDSWSMPPWGWANLLVPHFYTWQWNFNVIFQPNQGWTTSYYIGIGALALAGVAAACVRSAAVRLLSLMVLVSLVISLGTDGHLYPWLKRLVPPIGMLRYPIKFVVTAVFVVPWLAGIAWARLGSLPPDEARPARNRLAGIGLGMLLLLAGVTVFGLAFPYGNTDLVGSAVSRALLLLGVMALAWAVIRARTPAVRAGLALAGRDCLGAAGIAGS